MSTPDQTNEADPEQLWTVKDVARFLRMSPSWVYLHTGQGDLPYRRIGGLLRFFEQEIKAYARGEVRPSAAVRPLRPRAS